MAVKLNIAVVTVIHQPSFEIFSQFHNVYILSKVGSCVFQGSPKLLQEHLIAYEYLTPSSNPADTIISIASCLTKEDDDEVEPITVDVEADNSFHTATTKTPANMKADCERMTQEVIEKWRNGTYTNSGIEIQVRGLCSYDTKFKWHTFYVLMKRTFTTSLLRQKQSIFTRLALHVVVVVIMALLYDRNLGVDSGCYTLEVIDFQNCTCIQSEKAMRYESVPGRNVKFQFFSLLFLMFASMMSTVLTFPAEIKVYGCVVNSRLRASFRF